MRRRRPKGAARHPPAHSVPLRKTDVSTIQGGHRRKLFRPPRPAQKSAHEPLQPVAWKALVRRVRIGAIIQTQPETVLPMRRLLSALLLPLLLQGCVSLISTIEEKARQRGLCQHPLLRCRSLRCAAVAADPLSARPAGGGFPDAAWFPSSCPVHVRTRSSTNADSTLASLPRLNLPVTSRSLCLGRWALPAWWHWRWRRMN